MTTTLAIDPGKRHAGWALFYDRELRCAGIVTVKAAKARHGPDYRQGRHKQEDTTIARTIAEAVKNEIGGTVDPLEIVCEFQHIYTDKARRLTNRSDPTDLLFLAYTVGAIVGAQRASARVRLVEPSEWKGQRPDEVTWMWIRDKLNSAEQRRAANCHVYDELDRADFHHGLEAIGIGLWSLFRL